MNEFLTKQVAFTTSNISLVYISPYVDVAKYEDKVYLKRHESDSMVVLEIKSENATMIDSFLKDLKVGIKEEKFKEILSKLFLNEADVWYQNLILEGIVE